MVCEGLRDVQVAGLGGQPDGIGQQFLQFVECLGIIVKSSGQLGQRVGQRALLLAVGIVWAPAGRLQAALALTVSAERRITAIDVIADPDRLRRLRLAVLPD